MCHGGLPRIGRQQELSAWRNTGPAQCQVAGHRLQPQLPGSCQQNCFPVENLWKEWRARVRARARTSIQRLDRTGGGPADVASLLSEIDCRVMSIVGWEGVIGSMGVNEVLPSGQALAPAEVSVAMISVLTILHSQIHLQFTSAPPEAQNAEAEALMGSGPQNVKLILIIGKFFLC